jgi:hypothetical protein
MKRIFLSLIAAASVFAAVTAIAKTTSTSTAEADCCYGNACCAVGNSCCS